MNLGALFDPVQQPSPYYLHGCVPSARLYISLIPCRDQGTTFDNFSTQGALKKSLTNSKESKLQSY